MKKLLIIGGLLFTASTAFAAISIGTAPTSLVTSATTVAASSEKAVFEFALTANDSETLTSVGVTVTSSTAVAGDFTEVSVYRDDGDGSYDSGDTEAGSNSTVNIGSTTTISVPSDNTLTGSKFFVVLKTSATWSGTDSVTVSLNANGLVTSSNSPTTSLVTTSAITVTDSTGPVLQTAVAHNKVGGTSAVEVGDYVVLVFNEATNKPTINAANIDTVLDLNNTHAWLDGTSNIGSATWNSAGTELTITLSAGNSVPTVVVGDTVTIAGSVIEDAAGNDATGSATITGSFSTSTDTDTDDDFGKTCTGGIINGRLYKVGTEPTVYLAAACKLKPFRGAAVFHARGYKFQNIITLSSLTGLQVSDQPALPAGGTLVKGSDKTVWFVTENGKRKGFASETAFKRLGFNFGSVKVISDSDLQMITPDTAIEENSSHPEGAVVKCSNSATVYMIKGNMKHAFTKPQPYLDRGHTWDAIAAIDCTVHSYQSGSNIEQ